jgi:hypothetical protein
MQLLGQPTPTPTPRTHHTHNTVTEQWPVTKPLLKRTSSNSTVEARLGATTASQPPLTHTHHSMNHRPASLAPSCTAGGVLSGPPLLCCTGSSDACCCCFKLWSWRRVSPCDSPQDILWCGGASTTHQPGHVAEGLSEQLERCIVARGQSLPTFGSLAGASLPAPQEQDLHMHTSTVSAMHATNPACHQTGACCQAPAGGAPTCSLIVRLPVCSAHCTPAAATALQCQLQPGLSKYLFQHAAKAAVLLAATDTSQVPCTPAPLLKHPLAAGPSHSHTTPTCPTTGARPTPHLPGTDCYACAKRLQYILSST